MGRGVKKEKTKEGRQNESKTEEMGGGQGIVGGRETKRGVNGGKERQE